ncbi:embryo sac development arrest protein [Senna tora]|uniref:Embryo sac development arrest protein n=1 Tax=Senna tora TaxID=362788 RepID=A0A834X2U5_9FABA|nr:embryo sac development arrest protein [Senna tora]
MMSHHTRRILPPGATRKRKEREAVGLSFSGPPLPSPSVPPRTTASSAAAAATTEAGEPLSSNRLLAGYMAHEFLTKGTLFGQKFEAAGSEAVPLAGSASASQASSRKKEHERYNEVASLVKSDGAYIPGIVNPSQLCRWIKM